MAWKCERTGKCHGTYDKYEWKQWYNFFRSSPWKYSSSFWHWNSSAIDELLFNDKSELEDFEKIEKVYIEKSLKKYGDDTENKKYIADKMNIGLTTLYRKMKKYDIK